MVFSRWRGSRAILLMLFAAGCRPSPGAADDPGGLGPDASVSASSFAPAPHASPRPGRLGPSFGPLAVDGGDDGGVDGSSPDAGTPGGWQRIASLPSFFPGVPLLLTDGSVLFHTSDDESWWRFVPDVTGSYLNGTWSEVSPLPPGFAPTFFASAVLPDGRVVAIGGEYDRNALVETALGAVYDPPSDTWTPLPIPSSWVIVGDAPSVVLPDGTFLLGDVNKSGAAMLDARTLTWTEVPPSKGYLSQESGWTLLPSGNVLTIDVQTDGAYLYTPGTQRWTATTTPMVDLADSQVFEIGPAVLMPGGSVFAVGATAHTALYKPDATWVAGPDMPSVSGSQLDAADGPAALMPNGHVMFVASPGDYQPGAVFLDFDGTTVTTLPGTLFAPQDSSFNIFLMVLPSGQVLATDGSTDIEIYTPVGAPDPSWAPTITAVAATLARGSTNQLQGTQLNGLSQAVAYGDDYQAATNYPLVRLTNVGSGHVVYARTHDHSTMGVATGTQVVSTLFDVPASAETGPTTLVVVANGIASTPTAVTIQ
ncbi:MAG TPA: kelch repeat-containing protein [Polyangiaceae bacterium]